MTAKTEDGKTSTTLDPDSLASAEFQRKSEELQTLSPYTVDQVKAMLPEEIAGAKRKGSSANSAMGTAFAHGEYTLNDSATMELSIFDCGGAGGSGFYTTQYLTMLNVQSETEDEYTRTVPFKLGRAIEHVDKSDNSSSFTWLAADRLMVTLEGKNTGIEQLKQLAAALRLK